MRDAGIDCHHPVHLRDKRGSIPKVPNLVRMKRDIRARLKTGAVFFCQIDAEEMIVTALRQGGQETVKFNAAVEIVPMAAITLEDKPDAGPGRLAKAGRPSPLVVRWHLKIARRCGQRGAPLRGKTHGKAHHGAAQVGPAGTSLLPSLRLRHPDHLEAGFLGRDQVIDRVLHGKCQAGHICGNLRHEPQEHKGVAEPLFGMYQKVPPGKRPAVPARQYGGVVITDRVRPAGIKADFGKRQRLVIAVLQREDDKFAEFGIDEIRIMRQRPVEHRHGLVHFPDFNKGEPEIVEGVKMPGINRETGFKIPESSLRSAKQDLRCPAVDQRVQMIRFDRKRLVKPGQRLGRATVVTMNVADVEGGFELAWLPVQHSQEMIQRGIIIAGGTGDAPQIEQRFMILRGVVDHCGELRRRRRQIAMAEQRDAQKVTCVNIGLVRTDQPPKGVNGKLRPAGSEIDARQIEMR